MSQNLLSTRKITGKTVAPTGSVAPTLHRAQFDYLLVAAAEQTEQPVAMAAVAQEVY